MKDENIKNIRVTLELSKNMPAELRNRVMTKAQARAFCRGFLGHCEDIMAETIGVHDEVEAFCDAVDMGRAVVKRLVDLGGVPTGGWFQDLFEDQMDRWNGEK